jgi:CheY-like chemotaxis protein
MARILVIEDSLCLAMMYDYMLSPLDCAVEFVSDGAAGLAAIARERPALVLLDLMMPGMQGETFVQQCAACPTCAGVPILLLSAHPEVLTLAAAWRARGVVGALRKPFGTDELLAAVRPYLGGNDAGL